MNRCHYHCPGRLDFAIGFGRSLYNSCQKLGIEGNRDHFGRAVSPPPSGYVPDVDLARNVGTRRMDQQRRA